MYRKLLLAVGSLACAAFLTATSASAQIVFTLNNVSLTVTVGSTVYNAGSLTGTFTTDSNTLATGSTLTSWNIVAPSTLAINGHAFAGLDYTPTDSTVSYGTNNSLLYGFMLTGSNSTSTGDVLRFYFTTPLSTSAPVSLNTATATSYEGEQSSGGNRFVASGATVSAAPEPTSWALGFLALAFFVGLSIRRRGAKVS